MRRLTPAQTARVLSAYRLDQPSGPGFAFHGRARNTFYNWHVHPYHQLIYAIAGTTQIEVARARLLLPPGRAAWIPAGVRHRTLVADVSGASLYFAPETVPQAGERVRILVAAPVMREMILHALRWPLGVSETDAIAGSFFHTLALMCGEWLESELPLSLPSADHPGIARAMDYAAADLGAASLAGALSAAAMTERTFRRMFLRETGVGWQTWLAQARVMEAMCRLAAGARVTDTAAEVGYASLSAFARAFAHLTGEAPAAFRRRAATAARPGSSPAAHSGPRKNHCNA
jgi:AraC-like DNA-binding protein/mannose-6-phosphate isomerase-like protein (cupin superfamily)